MRRPRARGPRMAPPLWPPPQLAGVLAALVLAAGCGPAVDPFASAPFIQNVSTSGASVAMVTAAPVRLTVALGEGGGERTGTEAEPTRFHAVRFEGLDPDTAYPYRVTRADTGASFGGASFHTAPPAGSRPIAFAALGDSGTYTIDDGKIGPLGNFFVELGVLGDSENGRVQRQVAAQIRARSPDLALHVGDIVYPSGAREDYAEGFFRPFGALIATIPLFPVLGNHDIKTDGGAPVDEAFDTPANNPEHSERYYSFDYGDVHFVGLDVVTDRITEPGSPEVQWLAEDLQASTAAWKVCFLHYPPWNDGKHGDSERVQWHLGPIFEATGVDLVLAGHDHNYQRFNPIRGVTYIVTGGGGHSLYPVHRRRAAVAREVSHFVLATADARRMEIEAIDADGVVFDRVVLMKDRGSEGGS